MDVALTGDADAIPLKERFPLGESIPLRFLSFVAPSPSISLPGPPLALEAEDAETEKEVHGEKVKGVFFFFFFTSFVCHAIPRFLPSFTNLQLQFYSFRLNLDLHVQGEGKMIFQKKIEPYAAIQLEDELSRETILNMKRQDLIVVASLIDKVKKHKKARLGIGSMTHWLTLEDRSRTWPD